MLMLWPQAVTPGDPYHSLPSVHAIIAPRSKTVLFQPEPSLSSWSWRHQRRVCCKASNRKRPNIIQNIIQNSIQTSSTHYSLRKFQKRKQYLMHLKVPKKENWPRTVITLGIPHSNTKFREWYGCLMEKILKLWVFIISFSLFFSCPGSAIPTFGHWLDWLSSDFLPL